MIERVLCITVQMPEPGTAEYDKFKKRAQELREQNGCDELPPSELSEADALFECIVMTPRSPVEFGLEILTWEVDG